MYNDREIKLGKVFGIEIGLDYSWFWIFLLVTYTFVAQLLPVLSPMEPVWRYFFYGIFSSLLFFASVLAHELAHSLVANAQGDKVNKISLFLFGGVANLEEEPSSAKDEIKMAIVGPAISVVIGFVLLGLSFLFELIGFMEIFVVSLAMIGYLNFVLAIFNMLPGFPLDGGRVFRGILWYFNNSIIKSTKIAVIGGKVIAAGLIGYGIFQIVFVGALGGLWLILIGFFLYQAAATSLTKTMASQKLGNLTVGELIDSKPLVVAEGVSISEIIDTFRKYRRNFIFTQSKEGDYTGIISRSQIGRYSTSQNDVEAMDLANDLDGYDRIDISQPANKVISKITKGKDNVLLLESGGEIVNYFSLEDLRYYLESHNLLES